MSNQMQETTPATTHSNTHNNSGGIDFTKIFSDFDIPEETTKSLVDKLQTTFQKNVEGIVKNRDSLLKEKKELEQQFKHVKNDTETLKSKYAKITDIDMALEAIEKLKKGNQDIDVEVAKRTKSLKEDHNNEVENLRKQLLERDSLLEKEINEKRKTQFEYQIRTVANEVGVTPEAVDQGHFAQSMSRYIRWDDEEKAFVARDLNGDKLYQKASPTEPATMKSIAMEILPREAPHLYRANVNPTLNGSKSYDDANELFIKGSKHPNAKGIALIQENPERFKKLQEKRIKELSSKKE